MFVVDSHCHLDFPDFAPELEAVLARAQAAGVGAMLTISTRVGQFARYAALAEAHPRIWCTVGTHPHQAAEEPDITLSDLVGISRHPRCIGIGEAGLDYHYNYSPPDIAKRVFRTHIAAARETGLPLVIHARDADADMVEILTDEMGKGAFKAVLHCFSSGAELARVGVALGLFVSFSGILTFRNSQEIRDIAADVPLDRLLVETDAPFLAPMPHRGKRNEPAFVVETCKVLADVKGVPASEMARITTANFFRLFDKAEPPAGALA
jgi:TatD DNase family protein